MSKTDLTARKARWCAFYERAPEVPFLFQINCDPGAPPRPLPNPGQSEARVNWAWAQYERWMARAEWLKDDFLPSLDVYTGTEIFAEAFGCPVHRPDDNMPFALPIIHRAEEVEALAVPAIEDTPLAGLFDIADELRRRAGPEALMKLVDIQSPMDIAALIWDKNEFYIAMIETPEAVRQLAEKVHTLLTRFMDRWFARYGKDFIAHFPYYYMPQGLTLSEDEVGAVNGDMFDAFFAPELARLSERYGGLGMHCCANARHQWSRFARIPGLRVLNICQPAEIVREAYAYFAPTVAQTHGNVWDGPAWDWPAQFPSGARVIVEIGAATPKEAIELAARLEEKHNICPLRSCGHT